MNSRKQILAAIRNHEISAVELPSLQHDWIRFQDVSAQFSEAVAGVGGEVVPCSRMSEVSGHLRNNPRFNDAVQIYSDLSELDVGNVAMEDIDDPHKLADLDFAVFRGHFGVAENGAVWLTAETLRHRVAYFVSQHLAIVIRANEIVNNMHEAYERLQFTDPDFGLFMSGPSKTADIEQSLVIGAHGARSLTVFTVEI